MNKELKKFSELQKRNITISGRNDLKHLRESAKNNLPILSVSFAPLPHSSNPHVAEATLRFECLAEKQNNTHVKSNITSDVIREIILPAIEKEVNNGP